MTWQRWARLLVAAIGLACAAALIVYTHKGPAPPASPPARIDVDPRATVQGGAGRLVRHRGEQELGSIEYQATKTFADGRMAFEQPHIISSDERGFEAWADRGETKGKSVNADNPDEMEFTGHVRVKTKDGLELQTGSATYNDTTGGVKIPGPVTFVRGRMTGQGVGADYDRAQDVLTVFDQARVTVTPEADGKGAMSAVSKSMVLDRLHKLSRLDQGAIITHDEETLAGDTAILYWTDDEQQLRLIELRGHASVTQAANAAPGGPPDMHGESIDLTFHPDGHSVHLASLTGGAGPASIDLVDATGRRSITGSKVDVAMAPDGTTVTNLQAQRPVKVTLPRTADAPARVITSQTLVAQGNDKEGLKQARFDGGAEFVETVPGEKGAKDSVRTGKARTLLLGLNGKIDAIDRATFSQDASFTDGDVRGLADEAQYQAGAGTLLLLPAARGPKKSPQVVDANLQVQATQSIKVNVNTHDLDAAGDVTTVSRPAASSTPPPQKSALFDYDDPNRPIYGAGDTLRYTSDAGRARYTSKAGAQAQVWQDQNRVQGDEVTIESETHNLRATGHVTSRYYLTPKPAAGERAGAPPPKPVEYRGESDSLDYQDAKRVAVYVGVPASLKSVDGTTTAPHIDVLFTEQGNDIDKLDATGGAYALIEGGREAVAQRLVYSAATDTYTLTGSTAEPARVKLPNADRTECTKAMGEKLTFTRQSGSADGARLNEKLASCSISIKDPVK